MSRWIGGCCCRRAERSGALGRVEWREGEISIYSYSTTGRRYWMRQKGVGRCRLTGPSHRLVCTSKEVPSSLLADPVS